MTRTVVFALMLSSLLATGATAMAQTAPNSDVSTATRRQPTLHVRQVPVVASNNVYRLLNARPSVTSGTVTVGGKSIAYTAVAGTLLVDGVGKYSSTPIVAMSYFAYFKKSASPSQRPITFIYDGGPGSSTIWMHMGGFGPLRVVTADHTSTRPAPYRLINNQYSLLNATDLVFIDAPGTGFGRLLPTGENAAARAIDRKRIARAVWGIRGDAETFSRFVATFLSKYNRWNSPKYIFGESYGTMRSAVLADILEQQDGVNLNGVIMMSQVLNYHDLVDNPSPGDDLAYVLALPSFAATAWYHHMLPKYNSESLSVVLRNTIQFATTTYQQALLKGNTLDPRSMHSVAVELHDLIGLPTAYLLKAQLRVNGQMFTHKLLSKDGDITGRPDTRFTGAAMSPLGEKSVYDPLVASISSPYISAFNEYTRETLKFGKNMHYRVFIGHNVPAFSWNYRIGAPGQTPAPGEIGWPHVNVISYLADAMIYNPHLKVMLNGGFYDLACPFYAAVYQFQHMPIPRSLQKNISYAFYPSGHTIYVNIPSLEKLHANITHFIEQSDGLNR